jgi:biotin transporter BioY
VVSPVGGFIIGFIVMGLLYALLAYGFVLAYNLLF